MAVLCRKSCVKMARQIILGMLIAATASSSASADVVGLRVFREEPGGPGQPPPGPERWIYRVYAEFTEPTDMVLSWATGSDNFGFGGIWNITDAGYPGSGFTNIPDSSFGNTAPLFSGTFADWDTYMTVGLLYGIEGPGNQDATVVLVGTPLFISNGTTSWNGPGGVALAGNLQQGAAKYRVTGNDSEYRVLLMQLVVNAEEHVHGSLGVRWRPDGGESIITPNLQFNSIPSPGTAFVALILLLRIRRRPI